tara:strand:+ start:585 stop:752 length:168 start_codon:yes stop_codon:yes gene_type:complete
MWTEHGIFISFKKFLNTKQKREVISILPLILPATNKGINDLNGTFLFVLKKELAT